MHDIYLAPDGRSHGAEHGSNFERFEPKSLFLDLILNYSDHKV